MKKVSGMNYIILAMSAFASIGLELLLAFGIEPLLYGVSMSEWTDLQIIIHWVVTCILWGAAYIRKVGGTYETLWNTTIRN